MHHFFACIVREAAAFDLPISELFGVLKNEMTPPVREETEGKSEVTEQLTEAHIMECSVRTLVLTAQVTFEQYLVVLSICLFRFVLPCG